MRSFPWLVTDARLKTTIPRMEQGESTLEMVGRMLGRKLFVFFFRAHLVFPDELAETYRI